MNPLHVTPTQADILRCLAAGHTSGSIRRQLKLEVGRIRREMDRVMHAHGIRSDYQLMAMVGARGVVEIEVTEATA